MPVTEKLVLGAPAQRRPFTLHLRLAARTKLRVFFVLIDSIEPSPPDRGFQRSLQ